MEEVSQERIGIPLNKVLAQAGIASRRQAVEYIKKGDVRVNDQVVTEPGYRVQLQDTVFFKGEPIGVQQPVYILINKPKNCITTVSDERGRKTVLDYIEGMSHVRLYPVGRLDRNTTGLLVITNDGNLAQALCHPRNEVEKVYMVALERSLAPGDLLKLENGIVLEDGPVVFDEIRYCGSKKLIEVVLHSGRNRVVRRSFEHLGYEIDKLDRVSYAGLTKKNLRLGQWRFLSEREVELLKAMATERTSGAVLIDSN